MVMRDGDGYKTRIILRLKIKNRTALLLNDILIKYISAEIGHLIEQMREAYQRTVMMLKNNFKFTERYREILLRCTRCSWRLLKLHAVAAFIRNMK